MTETEGTWFWEDDGEHCGATKFFPSYSCTFVGACDREKGHTGPHSAMVGEKGSQWREDWDDRSADKANRAHVREMVVAFGGDELPYEDGI